MPHDSTFFVDLGLSWTKPTSKVATSAILIPSSAMVATDWSHQLRCKHCGKVVARSVLDDMKAQIALGVCCISQAVYMLRTKMYWFKTTPNDVNTYIYIGQQLKRRRTCPIGWRGHVFRWHVHTFWLPKLWNRQIPGETCDGSAVSTAESGSAPGHPESAMFFPHRCWAIAEHYAAPAA